MTMFKLLRNGLIGLAAALAISVPGWSQSTTTPKIIVFLADPQVGVAGAVVQGDPNAGGTILYFQEVVPAGSTAMSARLLDDEGRTIAISGHSMDSTWLATPEFGTAYDQTAAAQSFTLAPALSSGITSAMPGGAAFAQEANAIAGLASAASAQSAGTSALVADFAVANVVTLKDDAQLASLYEAIDVANLAATRDSLGNLNVTFNGATVLNTFVLNLSDLPNVETGELGITEVSAQLFGNDGYPVATQFGGDDLPINFNITNMFLDTIPAGYDPILHLQAVGQAVRAVALLGRNPSIATSDEVAALTGLALDLQTNDLRATSNSVDTSTATNSMAHFQQVGVWRRTLVGFTIDGYTFGGEHSGTIIRNWKTWACGPQGRDQCVYHYNPTVFCNHGTCPRTGDMTLKDKWVSPARSRFFPVPEVNAPAGGFPTQKAKGKHSCYKTNYDISSGFLCWLLGDECVSTNSLGQHTGGHNCNDDSWTQISAVRDLTFKLDNVNSNGRKCEDTETDDHAPSAQNPGP